MYLVEYENVTTSNEENEIQTGYLQDFTNSMSVSIANEFTSECNKIVYYLVIKVYN